MSTPRAQPGMAVPHQKKKRLASEGGPYKGKKDRKQRINAEDAETQSALRRRGRKKPHPEKPRVRHPKTLGVGGE
jgi:hypothetical protein